MWRATAALPTTLTLSSGNASDLTTALRVSTPLLSCSEVTWASFALSASRVPLRRTSIASASATSSPDCAPAAPLSRRPAPTAPSVTAPAAIASRRVTSMGSSSGVGLTEDCPLTEQTLQLRDDPERRLASLHPLDVVEAVAIRLRPVVPRRPGGVRRQDDVGELEERVGGLRGLLDHHVEAGASDRARCQGLVERILVHHRAAARVHEDRRLLHHCELLRGHHLPGDVVQRYVQRHDVGGAQQLGEQREANTERVLLVPAEPHHVVVAHVHVEAAHAARDLLADVAQADDP